MTKVKYLVLVFIVVTLMLVFPNIANAAENTYEDTAQGITWEYEQDDNGNIINLRCKTTSKSGVVTIPSTIDGKTVISLADDSWDSGAFEDCAGITEITIPDTITRIGNYAFKNCSGLKKVTIPDSVTIIGHDAFYNCTGLTSITLPANLTTIGSSAFSGSSLKKITVPDNVVSIGYSAFYKCAGLSEVNLSKNLTVIEGGTFRDCSALKTIIIPDNVTTIKHGGYGSGGAAFGNCKSLEKILIPDTVVSIDDGVFDGCNKLTIYGNEGMTSKEYADTNSINFRKISEWNNSNVGDDITSPIVETIEVTDDSIDELEEDDGMFMLPTGGRIVINVYCNEALQGTITPTLTIRCGQGKNIELTNGVISAKHIIYNYTVKEGDVGIISVVDLKGGNLTDAAGNEVQLSVKQLTIGGYSWNRDKYIYANGIVSNPETTNVPVESVSLNQTKITLEKGKTATLVATVKPTNATNKAVTFKSSNESIAKVDSKGVITAVAKGTATITVTTTDGQKTATCEVTVTEKTEAGENNVSVESVSLNQTKVSLEKGKTATLVATVKPTNATNKAVTYKSSNESVAKVDSKGVITAVAKGTATITVTTADGQKTATCEVIVTEATNKTDGTEAPGKIPQAGIEMGIIVAIIAVTIAGVVVYSRYNKMSDI